MRKQSRQPTRLLHRNATSPLRSELGEWLRSLALVTYRLSPIGSHMIIIHNFRELRLKRREELRTSKASVTPSRASVIPSKASVIPSKAS